eukprot:TRINITY_DN2800_c0_g2_i1.p1 TRINITY_DN2800_c0_g2~~TRINITY_DN2800_c0_g2_i1.p1  ORF type:complete len:343 (+),score=115.71 TRINITY_DN2800_c0_g2_i1:720-1748(+)
MQEATGEEELLRMEEQIRCRAEELSAKSNMLNGVLQKLEAAKNEKLILDQSFTPIHMDEQKYVAQVIKRAIKLSCYVASSESGVRYPSIGQGNSGEYWKFLNFFTKQIRTYIREAEEDKTRLAEFKKQKEEFISYVEKEVSELTKSWNLVEEQKKKANQMLQKVIEKEQCVFKETESKKDLIEADIKKVKEERNELSREVTGLNVALENQKTMSEALNKAIAMLRKNIDGLAEDKRRLTAETAKIRREEELMLTELRSEKERVKEEIERYKVVLANIESTKKYEDRERILLGLDKEIDLKEQELAKYSNKVTKYKNMAVELKSELKSIQDFSDTCLFNPKNF